MKQRITAILTAALLLLHPLPVRASAALSYSKTRYGGVDVIIAEGRFTGFLLVTDETVSQETLAAVKGVSSVLPLTGENYARYEFTAQTLEGFSRYGSRAAIWLVMLKPAYMEILMEYCQDYTMLIDGALDALYLDYTDYSTGYWNGGLNTSYYGISADAELLQQQLDVETRAAAFYAEWREELDAWEALVSAEDMTMLEYSKARQEAGILSDYEMVLAGEAYADEMRTVYASAESVRCRLDFTLDEVVRRFDGVSVWAHIGNCNMDDKVDAQDAATVLLFSAAQGAGREFRFTEDQLDAADVSRDGIINAADASTILRYAAGAGAESDAAIFQYLK